MTKPVRPRRLKGLEEFLTPEAVKWLRGENDAWEFLSAPPGIDVVAFWLEHERAIVAEHVAQHPGTRPRTWWRFSAPEARRRLGGRGDLKLGYTAVYELGIPRADDWAFEALDPKYFGGKLPVPVDPRDPPRFESQAAFLDRLGLLRSGERGRLTEVDYVPEVVARVAR